MVFRDVIVSRFKDFEDFEFDFWFFDGEFDVDDFFL